MADLNSSRVFAKALAEGGLGGIAEAFERRGWTTHGDFAYSCGVPPGQPEHDVRFVEEVVIPLTGERDSTLKPKLRRLFHESWTYQLAELRRTTRAPEGVGLTQAKAPGKSAVAEGRGREHKERRRG